MPCWNSIPTSIHLKNAKKMDETHFVVLKLGSLIQYDSCLFAERSSAGR